MADNPYLKRGLDILEGNDAPASSATSAPTAAPNPYLERGTAILDAPLQVTTMDPGATPQFSPDWTWRGLTRQVGGALMRAPGNAADVLSDPYANLVGYPLTVAGQTAYDFLAPMLGGKQMTPEQRNALYADFGGQPGRRAVESISRAGGVDPYNVPGTPDEKFVGKVVEGAVTGATLAPVFSGPGVARGLPGWRGAAPLPAGTPIWNTATGPVSMTSAATAGGTGMAASEIVQNSDKIPEEFKPAAGLVANVAGAKAGNMAANVGTRTVGALTGKKTPLAEAFDRLGIDRETLGDVTQSEAAKSLQAYASQAPGSAGTVLPKERKLVGQFGDAVENTASSLGTATSEQKAGEALQSEARNWKDVVFPQRQAQAWRPVDQMLGNESVTPANYRTALTSLTSKLAGLPETQKALVPGKVWQLLESIDKDVPAGQSMPWQQAQALRTAIGQVMGVPEIVQAVGKDQLKNAYGGISRDMQDTARTVDVRNNAAAAAAGTPPPASAVDAFTNANKVSTDGHAFIEGPLSKVIRANNPAQEKIDPAKAASSVLGSGDTTLEALRREMPKAADELAAHKLRDMLMATPARAGASGSEASVGTFLTELNKLRQSSPAGFKALFSDPAVAQRVADLATVAAEVKDTASRLNTSRTGPYMTVASMLGAGGLGASGAMLGLGQGLNSLYPIGAAAVGLGANYGLGKVVTNPWLAKVASAPGPRNVPNALMMGLYNDPQRQRENALSTKRSD